MAKFELKFNDEYDETTLKVWEKNGLIFIEIEDENTHLRIDFSKSTAIKFAKTLRTEINKITESEVDNG